MRASHDAVLRQGAYRLHAVERVVGLSKLARLADIFARRCRPRNISPRRLRSDRRNSQGQRRRHDDRSQATCMSVHGVPKHGTKTFTSRSSGMFRDNPGAGTTSFPGARAAAPELASGISWAAHVHIRPKATTAKKGRIPAPIRCLGLITCATTDVATGEVLMVAHMNERPCAGHRQRRGLVLQPLAPGAVAQGRNLRPCPAGRRDAAPIAIRTRSGCASTRRGACHTGRRPVSTRGSWKGDDGRLASFV